MTTTVDERVPRTRVPRGQVPGLVVVGVGVLACLVTALVQTGHGAVDALVVVDLIARVVSILAGAAVIGSLLLHLCAPAGTLGSVPEAAAWARGWVGALTVALVLEVLSPASVVARVAVGPDAAAAAARMRWLVGGLGLAALVLVLIPAVRSRTDALLVLALAGCSTVVTGGLGHGGSVLAPTPGSVATTVHVLAASAWLGGLLALVVRTPALRSAGTLTPTASAYSRLALACYVLLLVSGLLALGSRTSAAALLASGPYLGLVTGKAALLLLLGVAGAVQRRACLARVAEGRPRGFLLLSVAELVAMSVAAGLAVTLTHTTA